MFGYIRPLKDELKVREYEQFKACYCGLCHALKKEYGPWSRFLLTYDFTFLAMLLWEGTAEPDTMRAVCPVSPLRKKTACSETAALRRCAGYSVILSWWKLKDTVDDEGFFAALRDRLLLLVFRGKYRRASRLYPQFEKAVRTNLLELRLMEKEAGSSLDACADKFALVTAAMSADAEAPEKRRPLEQALYHAGRFIYILDACDDLTEDVARGRFNPLAGRYELVGGRLRPSDAEALKTTLLHSCRMIGAAFELLPGTVWTSITRNIVYLGMIEALNRVFCSADKRKNRT